MQGAALVGVCCLRYCWDNERRSWKSSWSYRLMSLKAYQTDRTVGNTHRQDFKTMDSYRGSNCFIFHRDRCKVKRWNAAFKLQSNPAGMCDCMNIIDQPSALPDDASCSKKLAQLNFFARPPCAVLPELSLLAQFLCFHAEVMSVWMPLDAPKSGFVLL